MAHEVFLDTSAFYALLARNDDAHAPMGRHMARAARLRHQFVTTDYVLDETATLLKARGYAHLAAAFLANILASQSCRIVWMDSDLFSTAAAFFSKHADQAWSFTDCVSFVVMRQLKLHAVLTKDQHFRAAGFDTPLIP